MSRALPCGDDRVVADGRLVAVVERKSIPGLVSSVTNGNLRYLLGDLAALLRAAVVVEDRYSALFKQRHARPNAVADALAEYQIRWPTIPIVLCETRLLAGEWTYRYLAAAWQWAATEPAAQDRTTTTDPLLLSTPDRPEPTVAEVRAWARRGGLDVPDAAGSARRCGPLGVPPNSGYIRSFARRRLIGDVIMDGGRQQL